MSVRNINCKIFVANLPWTIGTKEFKEYFSKYGKVFKAEVKFDWSTGISKGYGFVIFNSESGAFKALEEQNHTIEGGKLYRLKMGDCGDDVSEDLKGQFTKASAYVKSYVSNLKSQQILEFYGLYKQATEGPCTKPKPSWYEITEKQKWEAWSSLQNLDSTSAMSRYIFLLNSIEPQWEEKTVESSGPIGSWVHHSSMKNEDEQIEDCNKTIFDWVKENNLTKVKKLADEIQPQVNKLDENGLSLLHWSTDRGNLEIVKFLIEHLKADINVKDINGQTPLHYAVSCEYDDVIKYLIDAGADVNVTDNDGLNPYEANV